MRIRKRTLDLSALFLLCLGLGLVAFRFSNTFQMVVLSLIGRGRPCSLRDLGSGPSVKEHFARLDQLRRQVRQVRQDKDGLQLCETPE